MQQEKEMLLRENGIVILWSPNEIVDLFLDRGILMTFGNGMHGALGHGNHNDVGQAKIVEQLIGFEVKQVWNILHPSKINKQIKWIT